MNKIIIYLYVLLYQKIIYNQSNSSSGNAKYFNF